MSARPGSTSVGRALTLTATVKSIGRAHGAPQGDVTFLEGTSVLDTVSLRDGRAVFKTTSLAIGHDRVQVEYGGDADFWISSSAAISVTIRARIQTQSPATLARTSSSVHRYARRLMGNGNKDAASIDADLREVGPTNACSQPEDENDRAAA